MTHDAEPCSLEGTHGLKVGNTGNPSHTLDRDLDFANLGILFAITAGGIVWGVAGAFLAPPLVAIATRAAAYLASRGQRDAAVDREA